MATAVLAGDLTASLSFFLAQEIIIVFEDVFGVNEVLLLALFVTAFATWVAKLARAPNDNTPTDVLWESLHEVSKTTAFLSGVITVQLAMHLVRNSIGLASARVLTVLSTLLLIRTVLFATDLSKHELVYRPAARGE